MARRDGGTMALSLATIAIPAMRRASLDVNDVEVNMTAAGDTVEVFNSLRDTYSLEWEALLEVATTYVIPGNAVGTETAWVLKTFAAEAGGIASGFSKINRFHIEAAYDGEVALSGTLGPGPSGTPISYDLQP
jgi:hypothetical protein